MPGLTLVENTDALPSVAAITDDEGAAMARAVVGLFDRWGVSDGQAAVLLGGISARTWARRNFSISSAARQDSSPAPWCWWRHCGH